MSVKRLLSISATLVISLQTAAWSANFVVDNPADRIYNPAGNIKNPAANIYNPAAQMDNPSPISPPTQPIPRPEAAKPVPEALPPKQIKEPPKPLPKLVVPPKRYRFRTAAAYLSAAKNAFNRDNFVEFVSITDDALRRINDGTLRASDKTKQKLLKYRTFGYGLLNNDRD